MQNTSIIYAFSNVHTVNVPVLFMARTTLTSSSSFNDRSLLIGRQDPRLDDPRIAVQQLYTSMIKSGTAVTFDVGMGMSNGRPSRIPRFSASLDARGLSSAEFDAANRRITREKYVNCIFGRGEEVYRLAVMVGLAASLIDICAQCACSDDSAALLL